MRLGDRAHDRQAQSETSGTIAHGAGGIAAREGLEHGGLRVCRYARTGVGHLDRDLVIRDCPKPNRDDPGPMLDGIIHQVRYSALEFVVVSSHEQMIGTLKKDVLAKVRDLGLTLVSVNPKMQGE